MQFNFKNINHEKLNVPSSFLKNPLVKYISITLQLILHFKQILNNHKININIFLMNFKLSFEKISYPVKDFFTKLI